MKRETVEKPVQSAERQGEEIYELVKNWLGDVDEFTKTVAKAIIEDEDKANKGGCFKSGSCPNLIQRYKLGKEAAKAAVTGANLLGKGNFSSVFYRPTLQRTESMYIRGYEAFDSREQVLQEIMDTLKDGNVNIIGVYGMGGVGKTTLVKKIAWQVKEDKLFHEVAIAEVTPTPDNKKIQEKLAFDLGLEFRQENEYERAGLLRKRIKNEKNLLIILDNIWTKLDLDAIGIPLGDAEKERRDDNIKPFTILLTSRKRDVLSKDMKTQKNILVDTLSDDDAWKLFRKIVGDSAESSDFHPLAIEFVTKCSGLPVAISTVASTLKNESLHVWKDALAQLKRSNPRHIPDMEESVCSTIELSYKFLKDEEAKSLFLLCALKDVGSHMFTGDLLKYSMGLNLFGGVYSLEEGRNRLHRLIDYLKASCLLLEGDNDDAVKMHDIIHVVAVSIASTEKFMFNIQNVTGLKEVLGEKIPKDSTAISLPYGDIHYKLPQRLEFPKLKFFLFIQNRSLQLPDDFFEEMKELRVLDLTGFHFFSLPSSFSCLKNLKTLCLDNCLVEDLRILGELSKLEILSFLDSDIEQLPTEIGQLTRLKLLDLSNCVNLKYIAPNVISCLSQLEELYMGNNLVQWEDEGVDNQRRRNASLKELKQLSNLTALHLHVQDARVMPQDLFFKKLKSYKIFIGDKWKWSGNYDLSTSRTLKLKINDSIYLRHGIKSLLKMTEDLSLKGIKGFRNVLYEINADGFPHLRHLHVKDCLDILYIINSVARNQAFPALETLIICNLIKLEKICHGKLNAGFFSKLRIIKIDKCDRLEYLFASFMAKNLMQLQEIEMTDCKNLKELFGEKSDDRGEEIETNNKMEFNQLCSLTLQRLPKFIKIDSDMMVKLPTMGSSSCFQNLTILVIDGFDQLKYLFPSYTLKNFFKLKVLEISNCMFMERVIDADEGRTRTMLFPKLYQLKLRDLPKLTTFCNSTANFVEMSSLFRLWIDNCPSIQTFICNSGCGDVTSSNQEPKGMSANENSTQLRSLFDKKVRLPRLERLKVTYADHLIKLWNDEVSLESFCKLNRVFVHFCKRLVSVFPSNILGSHQKLEIVEVQNCDSVEKIFEVLEKSSGMVEEIVPKEEAIPSFVFSKLTELNLQMLPSLKSFFPEIHISEWPGLEVLKVHGCNNVKIFASELLSIRGSHGDSQQTLFSVCKDAFPSLEELELCEMPGLSNLWRGNFQPCNAFPNLKTLKVSECDSLENSCFSMVSLQNLETLQVSKCDGLRYLLTPSKAKTLDRLTRMNVSDCKMMEEIIAHMGDEVEVNSIVFDKLDCLELNCLSRLKRFCRGDYTLEFPSLKKVIVRQCLEMESFCHGVLSTPMLEKLQWTGGEDEVEERWEGDLNSTIHYLFKNMNVRSSKED